MTISECKIVFFDIDGTLLDSRHLIPESTVRSVQELQRAGIETVIATGRTPANFGHIREQLGIHSFVSLNGGYVVREGKVLASNKMQLHHMEQLNALATASGHAISWIGSEQIGLYADHPSVGRVFELFGMEIPPINPNFHQQCDIYQGMLFCSEEEITPYVKGIPELNYVRFDQHAVDVMPRHSNKAAGIAHYLKAAGVEAESCIAFGDGLNDIEMLQSVGLGIAMGQAREEVKRAAKRVTHSVDHGGIEAALVDIGLIGA